jgi:hypothetical protein
LHLLALVARGLGATGLAGYEPPADRVREWLDERPPTEEDRRQRILQIIAAGGGEVG